MFISLVEQSKWKRNRSLLWRVWCKS